MQPTPKQQHIQEISAQSCEMFRQLLKLCLIPERLGLKRPQTVKQGPLPSIVKETKFNTPDGAGVDSNSVEDRGVGCYYYFLI